MTNTIIEMDERRFATEGSTERPRADRPARNCRHFDFRSSVITAVYKQMVESHFVDDLLGISFRHFQFRSIALKSLLRLLIESHFVVVDFLCSTYLIRPSIPISAIYTIGRTHLIEIPETKIFISTNCFSTNFTMAVKEADDRKPPKIEFRRFVPILN